ncbi:glycosyltransferase [Agromyces sp. MMS24-K17]|uniref:glycosyltransferase n=1 Tax=Agromyces sp. MMS24-K17 TaxID=3372850 RepID=UPI003754CDD1
MTVSVPPSEHPVVTVVVIAWRLAAPLRDAIASVVASQDAPEYEVVVVLNGVADEVRAVLADEVDGVSVVDLGYNTGYGYAANRGAAAARGDHLLFLNDDAELAPDAMRTLVASMAVPTSTERPVGAAAALMLNADGTVQEAGSRMLGTAGTVQLGAGMTIEEARTAGMLRRRPIDYGSGAALLVRADLFRSIGGHDARYRPAYFEDADLAFRLRGYGYDVVLEPDAVAVHASGASTAKDRRFRDFAGEHAGRAFIDRWSVVLEGAPQTDDGLDRLCPVPRVKEAPAAEFAPQAEDPAQVALAIGADYQAWLNRQLDECRTSHGRLVAELEEARAEWGHWHDRAEELGSHAHELNLQLVDLESRGPIRLARWRVGVARRKRSERRAG